MFTKMQVVLILSLISLMGMSACSLAAGEAASPAPEAVVESFYAWYLTANGYDEASGEMRNSLVDGSYRERPELAPEMIERVEAILASFAEGPGGGYDPILCAQDIPTGISTGEAEFTGETARVPVETSFEGHSFIVELTQLEGQWLMSDVLCAAGN